MYPTLFKLVLSRFDPETAHHLGMAVIRVLGVPPFGAAARALTRPAPELAVDALGLHFPSPFGIAAGFDKNVIGARGLGNLGFGHIEIGTVTAGIKAARALPRNSQITTSTSTIASTSVS